MGIVEFRCPFCYGKIVARQDIDVGSDDTLDRAMVQHRAGCPILETYKKLVSQTWDDS